MLKARRPFSRHSGQQQDPGPFRRFCREAGLYLIGGFGSTLTQAALFLLLRELLGSFAANLIAVATTTVLSTEFHRKITFSGADSAVNRRWIQNGLTFAFYASYNTLVLVGLHAIVDGPSPFLESATLTTFAVVGGISRFLLMRWWVFHRDAHPEPERGVRSASGDTE